MVICSPMLGSHIIGTDRSYASAGVKQVSQPHQVVDGHGEHELKVDLACSAIFRLPKPTDRLAPAEALLNAFADALAHLIALMAGRASIDGKATAPLMILCHMRGDVEVTEPLNELVGVIGLVGTDRDLTASFATRPASRWPSPARRCRWPAPLWQRRPGPCGSPSHLGGMTELGRVRLALPIQPRVWIGAGGMRLIAAPLIMEIASGIASHPSGVLIIPAILAPETLLRGPSIYQRAIDTEMLIGGQPLGLRPRINPSKQRRARWEPPRSAAPQRQRSENAA